ncbi:MAG TPA: OB-fold domain-containing protein [Acidimicrobiales bacterium]|nr:OB-fold domain-containing protein [Acidimicrobiales bacterium]
MTTDRIPMVSYLDLTGDDGPRLRGNRCEVCSAVFFDRRNGCARCGAGPEAFQAVELSPRGVLLSFTIVHRAAPKVPTPYISVVVELDGGGVIKANLIGVEPDPASIKLGGRVELVTFDAGVDDHETTAVAFGFTPIEEVAA